MENYILWLSQTIDNLENQTYIKEIEKETHFKLIPYKEIDILFYKMKQIYFRMYIVIVSGRLFPLYIDKLLLDNKNLYSIPLTLIFTSKKELFKKNIDKNYKQYVENKYFNALGIVDSYEELKKRILLPINGIDNICSQITLREKLKPGNYEDLLVFEYFDDEKPLIFPYLYEKIMSKITVDYNSVKEFNLFLLKNFGKNKDIKELLRIFYECEDIPDYMVAKYWGKLYTLETPFYANLNYSLMKLDSNDYNTFIHVFYSGFRNLSFKFEDNVAGNKQILYRGSYITNKEIDKIIKYFKNNSNKKKLCMVYSRTFLSFTLYEKVAKKFISYNKDQKSQVLFKLENNSNKNLPSNADFTKINSYNEKEILFFPFSSFIINSNPLYIEKEKYYIINISYLGLYEKIIGQKIDEISNKDEIINEISQNSNFAKDVVSLQIMKNKNIDKIMNDKNGVLIDNKKQSNEHNKNENIIAKEIIKMNEENIKEKEEIKKEIQEEKQKQKQKQKIEEIKIENKYIKLCICKTNKSYSPKLREIFNMDIFEYIKFDDIITKIKQLQGHECLLILNEMIFPSYIDIVKNFYNYDKFPISIILTSDKKRITENKVYSKYINDKLFNPLGIVESYKELKEKIIEAINNYQDIIKNFNVGEQINDENVKIKLKILLKNLEAREANSDDIQREMNILVGEMIEEYNKNRINSDEILKKVYDIFDKYLQLTNQEDIKNLYQLLYHLYNEQSGDLNNFFEYMNDVVENITNYSSLNTEDEEKINIYIHNFMKNEIMSKRKEEIEKEYKNNYIIKFEDFEKIIMKNNEQRIFMANEAVEYLLYKMKKSIIKQNKNQLINTFDLKVFLDYYNDKEKVENNNYNEINQKIYKTPEY